MRQRPDLAPTPIVPLEHLLPGGYAEFARPILEGFGKPVLTTKETMWRRGVWGAVHDTAGQLRFPAGAGCDRTRSGTLRR